MEGHCVAERGRKNHEVARRLLSASGKNLSTDGRDFFEAHGPPWRKLGLLDKQRNRLKSLLCKGPRKHGYRTELGTLQRSAGINCRPSRH